MKYYKIFDFKTFLWAALKKSRIILNYIFAFLFKETVIWVSQFIEIT